MEALSGCGVFHLCAARAKLEINGDLYIIGFSHGEATDLSKNERKCVDDDDKTSGESRSNMMDIDWFIKKKIH